MSEIVLPDTSLCAIVRDEVMNPAGGVIDFVDSTMPFVEAGVIVDTGSIDGTRELLEELEAKYPNLKVLDREFDGYASSRNFSLDNVETGRVLVLDADERLTRDDFARIREQTDELQFPSYSFDFEDLQIGEEPRTVVGMGVRLFSLQDGLKYVNGYKNRVEDLYLKGTKLTNLPDNVKHLDIKIKHFRPNIEACCMKCYDWYIAIVGEGIELAPSQVSSFPAWKAYNPRREDYR